jgi:hypothetical protein
MLITFGGISLISLLGLDFMIPLILIPAWFFSFFESHHFRKQMEQGLVLKDQDIFDHQIYDYTPLLKNRRLIGATITIIGILSLMHELDGSEFMIHLFRNWNYYVMVRNSIVPLCLILAGVYMIVKAKKEA